MNVTLIDFPDEILLNIIKFIEDLRPLKETNKKLYELSKYTIEDFKKKSMKNVYDYIISGDLFSLQFIYYNIDNTIASNVLFRTCIISNDEIYDWFLQNSNIKNINTICIYLIVTSNIDKATKLIQKYFYTDNNSVKKLIKWMIRKNPYSSFFQIFQNFYKDEDFIDFVVDFSIKVNKFEYFKNLWTHTNSYDKICESAINYDNHRVLDILIQENKIKPDIELLKKCIRLARLGCQQIIMKKLDITTEYILSLYEQ